jgi:hypothetical protein
MAQQIISASGIQYGAIVNPDGSLNVNLVDDTFENPYTRLLYVVSGTETGVTGSQIGSIIKFIGAGSKIKVLSYSNDNLVNIGSWV